MVGLVNIQTDLDYQAVEVDMSILLVNQFNHLKFYDLKIFQTNSHQPLLFTN